MLTITSPDKTRCAVLCVVGREGVWLLYSEALCRLNGLTLGGVDPCW